MAVLLTESAIYQAQKANLTRATRLVLGYIEFEIASDPSVGENRRETDGGTIVDESADDLLVEYRRVNLNTVELYRVYDLRSIEPSLIE